MSRDVRIVGINASQRENSNSGRLLDRLLGAWGDLSGGDRASRFELREMRCACLGCERCFADARAHDDDMAKACDAMLQADVILFATPTCYGMPSALGKAVMDRTDAYWPKQLLQGKIGACIVNGASPDERITECAEAIRGYFEAHGMRTVPAAVIRNTKAYPDQRLPNPLPADAVKALEKLANDIGRLSGNSR